MPNCEKTAKRTIVAALAVVLLFSAGLRLVYFFERVHAPDCGAPLLDPQLNDYWARALATGDWTPPPGAADPEIRTAPYGRPPGYPFTLALLYALFGLHCAVPVIVQMILGVLNAALAFVLARRIWNAVAGIVAAALMGSYWTFIYFEGELTCPVWTATLTLGVLLLLTRWREDGGMWRLALAGALMGVFALYRPNALLPAFALALWCAAGRLSTAADGSTPDAMDAENQGAGDCRGGWGQPPYRHPCRRAVTAFVLFLAACMLPIAPALIRNYAVARETVLISYYGGVNAYIGNNPEAKGYSAEIPDIESIAGMKSWNCFDYPQLVRKLGAHLGREPFSFSDASRYFSERAARFWRERPLDALRLTARKALLFWGPAEISDSKAISLERAQSPLLRLLPGFPLAAILGALGAALAMARRRAACAGLLAVFIAAYFLSVLPFFIAGRYRLPVVPVLLVLGAGGLTELCRALRERDIRAVGMAFIAVAAAAALSCIHWLPYAPDAAQWHRQRAISWSAQGAWAKAAREYDAALELDPKDAESLAGRGFCRTRLGDASAGLSDYAAALEIAPGDAYTHNNLGFELAQLGRHSEAEAHYLEALRLDPKFALARNNLGNLMMDTGRVEEAMALFRAIAEDTPRDPHAQFNLGNALWRQGRLAEAEIALRAALDNNSRNPDILNNLGLLLAGQKRYPEAKRYYEKALETDARHAKAHFNLANILGEEGACDEAIRHYDAALASDPEFAQAKKNRDLVEKVRADTRNNE